MRCLDIRRYADACRGQEGQGVHAREWECQERGYRRAGHSGRSVMARRTCPVIGFRASFMAMLAIGQ